MSDAIGLAAQDLHVRWVMPEAFHDIPVGLPEDESLDLLEKLAREVLPDAQGDEGVRIAVACALSIDDLEAAGARYAGMCVVNADGAPAAATVYATEIPPDGDDDAPPTQRDIAASLRLLGNGDIREIDIPFGPAVAYIGSRAARQPDALTDGAASDPIGVSFIQVHVPLPNHSVLMMEMSTPTEAGWEAFSRSFADTVRSIRVFDESGAPVWMADLTPAAHA
ncbi:hypothetical protein [Streptomyces boninensis]|uniref:hypothetical protein n=1 Tax=Streptomyces boninensis TaxID=2039455 RepID=UPI003B223222